MYETLLVLALVAGLASLVSFQGQSHRDRIAERAFWPSWQRMWTAARQQAKRRQKKMRVIISSNRRVVRVYQMDTNQRLGQLTVPPSLKWRDGEKEWLIHPSGSAHARAIEWYSTASHQWFYQTFQLGGGMFYVEETLFRRVPRLGTT